MNQNAPQDPEGGFRFVEVEYDKWLGGAWRHMVDNIGLYLLTALLFIVVNLIPILMVGPLTAGFYLLISKRLRGEEATVGNLFDGFEFFVETLIVTLLFVVAWAVVGVAVTILCLIPCLGWGAAPVIGLFLGGMLYFAYFLAIALVADQGLRAMEALNRVTALFKQHVWVLMLFGTLVMVICMLGLVVCCVGVVFTQPIALIAFTLAYRDILGSGGSEEAVSQVDA